MIEREENQVKLIEIFHSTMFSFNTIFVLEGEINLSVSHIEPVYKTMWIQSKTLSEFFTVSTDGTVSSYS